MIRKAVLLAIYLLWALPAPAFPERDESRRQSSQRSDTIRLDTSLVSVPVIVKDGSNRFVTGLTRDNFLIREEGVEQEIASFSSSEEPCSVALLIDASPSTRYVLPEIRAAALDFIKQLEPQDRALIVAFGEDVRFLGDFTSDRRELTRSIRSIKSGIATALYDALYRTINEKFSSLKGRKAIVVFTDGMDSWSRQATAASALESVANSGAICYAIHYRAGNPGGPFLNSIAEQSAGLRIPAAGIEKTNAAFALIAEELRHQYTIMYYPRDAVRDGRYRAISVATDRAGLVVRARRGYRATQE